MTSWSGTGSLETTISKNGTAIFGRSGPTGRRGPPLEVDNFDRKISTWAEAFHYVWTEISRNFGIMESTPGLHYKALTGKILVFGLGGCRLKRGGRIWRFDCIKYGTYIPHLPLEKLFYCPESSSPGMNSYQHLQLLHYSKHKSFV